MSTVLTPVEGEPSIGSNGKGADAPNGPSLEDSHSETSTIDSDSEDRVEPAGLMFFTRLYELPVVNDTVTNVRKIAESNRYTAAIISYAEKAGGLAEKSLHVLKPVERPIAALDGYATRSLQCIENRYPIVTQPTSDVVNAMHSQAKAAEQRYPVIARTFAVAKSAANSAIDRVDYLVDYVLPPTDSDSSDSSDEPKEPASEQTENAAAETSPLGKVTILVHKVPQRLRKYYSNQLQASKSAVSGLKQSVSDTAHVYESEISDRSYRLLGSVQDRLYTTVAAIPSYLPQFAQQYYMQGKEIVVTKASKLHAEYSRTDCDARTKVLNLILISGEQVPVLEGITARIFGKAMGTDSAKSSPEAAEH
ncbi:hypothetical protein IWW36_000893 [Coemansia brasiliensis]|uniref:Perilipin-2 n=1 Tax=Coemansia brasiliensis TaxID=2650707 RepID=A0A9W8ICP6_9FUNG|nr:hypothetical protein IWW36_000893 [Coemansia brasiliensis]